MTSAAIPKVNAVRWGLEQVFGPASQLRAVPCTSNIAEQPVGHGAGQQGASQRADGVELSSPDEIIVSIENFVVETTPGVWFDIGHVLLRDSINDLELHTLSQAVQLPADYINRCKAQTPGDYVHSSTGFAVTCGEVIKSLKPHLDNQDWHGAACGLSRQQILHVAVRCVLGQYRRALTSKSKSAADSLSAILKT